MQPATFYTRLLLANDWIPMKPGADDATPVAAQDFTSQQTYSAASNKYRFVMIQAHDGILLVSILRHSQYPGQSIADDVDNSDLRIQSGTSQVFQLPRNTPISIKVKAVSGTVNGSVFFGL